MGRNWLKLAEEVLYVTALKIICRSAVIGRRNSVCDRQKASSDGYHDEYLDETATLADFNSKTIFAIPFNRQVKQTKSTKETPTNQTNHRLWRSKLMQILIYLY